MWCGREFSHNATGQGFSGESARTSSVESTREPSAAPAPIRFVLRSSYGNDSVALIQWAHEQGLDGVVVLYSDTGWARRWWQTERHGKYEPPIEEESLTGCNLGEWCGS